MSNQPLRVPRFPEIANRAIGNLGYPGYPIGGFTSLVRFVYHNGKVYLGSMSPDGAIWIGSYDQATQTWTPSPAIATGYSDWHCAPSILVRSSDLRIVGVYSHHDGSDFNVVVSTNPEDVTAWGTPGDIASTLGPTEYTYPTICQLSGESGRIYIFWRTIGASSTGQWWYSYSDDNGATWAAGVEFFTCATGFSGYVQWDTDNAARIDFVANDESANYPSPGSLGGSAYHFYYEGGSFYKTDGTVISASLPLTPADLTRIYDGSANGGMLQPGHVVTNGTTPRCTLIALDPAETNPLAPTLPLRFWDARYVAGAWQANEIVGSGFAGYTPLGGNPVPDPADDTRAFCIIKTAGGLWQVIEYVTADGGATWTEEQTLTAETDATRANAYVEPIRGAGTPVTIVWIYGPIPAGYNVFPQTWAIYGYPNPGGG